MISHHRIVRSRQSATHHHPRRGVEVQHDGQRSPEALLLIVRPPLCEDVVRVLLGHCGRREEREGRGGHARARRESDDRREGRRTAREGISSQLSQSQKSACTSVCFESQPTTTRRWKPLGSGCAGESHP